MKKVIIKEIELRDFRSISTTIKFNEVKTLIKGENGIGKTTIINAWRWLLLGKTDADHAANFELFDSRTELSPNTPTAKVRATIDIDGIEYTLERTAKAKFTINKETLEYEKSASDKYSMSIDDLEYTTTEFNNWLEHNIAPLKALPYVVDGCFFVSLVDEHKDKAIDLLLEIVGDVNDDDFQEDYSLIKPLLQKYQPEQIITIAKKKIKDIQEALTTIPVTIKTKEDMIRDLLCDFDSYEIERGELNQKLLDAQNKQKELNENAKGLIDEINAKLAELSSKGAKYSECVIAYKQQKDAIKHEKNNEIQEVLDRIARLETKEALEKEINDLNNTLDALRKKKDNIKSLQFDGAYCEHCGAELIDEESIAKAKESFNLRKDEQLSSVIKEGKRLASTLEDRIQALNVLNEIKETKEELRCYYEALKEEYDAIVNDNTEFADTEEGKLMLQEITDFEKSIPQKNDDSADIQLEIKAIIARLEEVNGYLGQRRLIEQYQKDIEQLKEQYKNLGADNARAFGEMTQAQQYIDERANIVSNKVNNMLKRCKIQMWRTQKDGTKVPDCVILNKQNVKFGSTNTSDRIKITVALQEFFQKAYDVSLPIFIDEMSVFSTNNIPNINQQHIMLFATEDKTMIVE